MYSREVGIFGYVTRGRNA